MTKGLLLKLERDHASASVASSVQFDDQEFLLEQGDALTFPGYTRHSFHNPDAAETARVLSVLSRALSGTTASVRS